MIKKIVSLLLLVFFLFSSKTTQAETSVLINEFLIDPSPQTVEVINKGTETKDISGWHIDDSGGTTYYTIPANSLVYPNACLVFSSEFNLNKSSPDSIRLFDNTAPPTATAASLIDSFSYKSSSGSAVSYFRLPDGESIWATGAATLGSLNTTGESCVIIPTPTPLSGVTDTLSVPTPTVIPDINNVSISEIMVNPETGEYEWLELFNNNDFAVSLQNWYIDDAENAGSSPKLFSLEIQSKNYASYNLPTSMFNNDGDSIRLLHSNKNLKDSLEYSFSQKSMSIGKINLQSDELCIQTPSKNLVNSQCVENQTTQVKTPTSKPTATKNQTTNLVKIIKSTPKIASSQFKLHQNLNEVSHTNDVLGQQTVLQPKPKKQKSLSKSFSLVSFGYSLLTISSVLFRIKFSA